MSFDKSCLIIPVRYLLFAAFLLLPGLAIGDDQNPNSDPPKPVPVFPKLPLTDPTPTPPPSPDAVPVVKPGDIYVVQSDAEFILIASPRNLVSIQPDQGPLKIRGTFADGSGKIETRTYQSKFLAIVDPADGFSGRVELIFIPVNATDESKIQRTLIDIGVAPRPPPQPPSPDVNPQPPVPQPPVPVDPIAAGFRVIIVHETSEACTREQLNTINSPSIAAYLTSHCVKGAGNVPEWRRWDKDVKLDQSESQTLKQIWEGIKPKLGKLPQIVISFNNEVKVYDLPATEALTLQFLQTFGGK